MQNIPTEELLQQLQSLNDTLAGIHITLLSSHTQGIGWDSIIAASSGLIGVLVGSAISYISNKSISDQNQKTRIAVGKKNTIYSKLYKELLDIRKSIRAMQVDSFYFELQTNVIKVNQTEHDWESYNFAGKRLPRSRYDQWQSMKDDIRHMHVPKGVKDQLNSLEKSVRKYFKELSCFQDEVEKSEKTMNSRMIELYQAQPNHHNSRFDIDFSGVYFKNVNIKNIVDENKRRYDLSGDELLVEMQKIVEHVTELDSRKELDHAFDKLTESLKETIESLEILIQNIQDRYEYGELL